MMHFLLECCKYFIFFIFFIVNPKLLVNPFFAFFRCGKTTQIPQFIFDSYLKQGRGAECFIICTQPRRISAMSVAERVSAERIDRIGESVGYQVRLENKQVKPSSSYLKYLGLLRFRYGATNMLGC